MPEMWWLWIKKNTSEQKCQNDHPKIKQCYLCCNSLRLGLYKECDRCYGSGKPFNKKNNKL